MPLPKTKTIILPSPGFYDQVLDISAEERAEMAKAPFDLNEYKKDLDINDVHGETGYSTNERTAIRPSLRIERDMG